MNKIKRLFITVCSVLFLVCATLFAASCVGTNLYTVTTEYDPAQGEVRLTPAPGSEGKYAEGTTIRVTVSAKSGYEIDTFTVNDQTQTLSSEGTFSFDIKQDTVIRAGFKSAAPVEETYSLNVTCNRDQGSYEVLTAPNSGTKYTKNTAVKIKITPNTGYEIADVTINNQSHTVTTSGELQFNIVQDTQVNITFRSTTVVPDTYTVSATAGAHGSIALNPEKTKYNDGDQVTVTVTPDSGYEVDAFTVSTDPQAKLTGNTYTLTVHGDTTISVTFKETAPVTYTVTVKPVQNGTVALNPQKSNYTAGEKVTVTLTPAADYAVDTLKVNGTAVQLTASNTYELTVDGDKELEATFKKLTYTVTVSSTTNGSVTLAPQKTVYEKGDTVTVTVTPNATYEVDTFTVSTDPQAALTGDTYTLTVSDNTTISATFKKITYAVTVTPPTNGALELAPSATNGRYEVGTEITVTITPEAHYVLDAITITGVEDPQPAAGTDGKLTVKFTVSQDTTIEATFKKDTHTVTITEPENGEVTLDKDGTSFEHGTELVLTVKPAEHYSVDTFTVSNDEDAVLTDEGTYTFTVTEDVTITVTFKKDTHTVTITEPTNGEVTLDKDGTSFEHGTELVLTVKPAQGFVVDTFTVSNDEDAVLTDEGTYTFTVTEDVTITVTFKKDTHTVTITEPENGEVTLDKDGTSFEHGTELVLTVKPAQGFVVDTFTVSNDEDAELTEEGTYTFTVTEDITITVTFKAAAEEDKFSAAFVGEWTQAPKSGSSVDSYSLTITADELTLMNNGESLNATCVAGAENSYTVSWSDDSDGHFSCTLTLEHGVLHLHSESSSICIWFVDEENHAPAGFTVPADWYAEYAGTEASLVIDADTFEYGTSKLVKLEKVDDTYYVLVDGTLYELAFSTVESKKTATLTSEDGDELVLTEKEEEVPPAVTVPENKRGDYTLMASGMTSELTLNEHTITFNGEEYDLLSGSGSGYAPYVFKATEQASEEADPVEVEYRLWFANINGSPILMVYRTAEPDNVMAYLRDNAQLTQKAPAKGYVGNWVGSVATNHTRLVLLSDGTVFYSAEGEGEMAAGYIFGVNGDDYHMLVGGKYFYLRGLTPTILRLTRYSGTEQVDAPEDNLTFATLTASTTPIEDENRGTWTTEDEAHEVVISEDGLTVTIDSTAARFGGKDDEGKSYIVLWNHFYYYLTFEGDTLTVTGEYKEGLVAGTETNTLTFTREGTEEHMFSAAFVGEWTQAPKSGSSVDSYSLTITADELTLMNNGTSLNATCVAGAENSYTVSWSDDSDGHFSCTLTLEHGVLHLHSESSSICIWFVDEENHAPAGFTVPADWYAEYVGGTEGSLVIDADTFEYGMSKLVKLEKVEDTYYVLVDGTLYELTFSTVEDKKTATLTSEGGDEPLVLTEKEEEVPPAVTVPENQRGLYTLTASGMTSELTLNEHTITFNGEEYELLSGSGASGEPYKFKATEQASEDDDPVEVEYNVWFPRIRIYSVLLVYRTTEPDNEMAYWKDGTELTKKAPATYYVGNWVGSEPTNHTRLVLLSDGTVFYSAEGEGSLEEGYIYATNGPEEYYMVIGGKFFFLMGKTPTIMRLTHYRGTEQVDEAEDNLVPVTLTASTTPIEEENRGKWTTEDGAHEVVISEDGLTVTIDSVNATLGGKDDEGTSYIVLWNHFYYYLTFEDGTLTVMGEYKEGLVADTETNTLTFTRGALYTVTVDAGEGGTVTLNGGEELEAELHSGTEVVITITPAEHKALLTLMVNGNDALHSEELVFEEGVYTYTFTLTETTAIEITFGDDSHILSVNVEGTVGTVENAIWTTDPEYTWDDDGFMVFTHGTTVTLTVKFLSGYEVTTFKVDEVDQLEALVKGDNYVTYELTFDEDHTLEIMVEGEAYDPALFGTWMSVDGDYTLTIAESGLTLSGPDGDEDITAKTRVDLMDNDGTLTAFSYAVTVTWNEKEYSLMNLGDENVNCIYLSYEDEAIYFLRDGREVEIDAKYHGTYVHGEETIVVSADSVTRGEDEIILITMTDDALKLFVNGEIATINFYLESNSLVFYIDKDLDGSYSGDTYTLQTSEATKFIIEVSENDGACASVDFEGATPEGDDHLLAAKDAVVTLTFTMRSRFYMVESVTVNGSSADIVGNAVTFTVTSYTKVEITYDFSDALAGEWRTAEDAEGEYYTLTFADLGVELMKGDLYEVVSDFDAHALTFTWNEKSYKIEQTRGTALRPLALTVVSGDEKFYFYDEAQAAAVEIPTSFVGVWEMREEGVLIRSIVITEDSITYNVYIGAASSVAWQAVAFNGSIIAIGADGIHELLLIDETMLGDSLERFYTKAAEYTVTVTCDPNAEYTLTPEGNSYLSGTSLTLTVEYDKVYYSVSVSVDGKPVELVDDSYEFEISANTEIVITLEELEQLIDDIFHGTWTKYVTEGDAPVLVIDKRTAKLDGVNLCSDGAVWDEATKTYTLTAGETVYRLGCLRDLDAPYILWLELDGVKDYYLGSDGVLEVTIPEEFHGTYKESNLEDPESEGFVLVVSADAILYNGAEVAIFKEVKETSTYFVICEDGILELAFDAELDGMFVNHDTDASGYFTKDVSVPEESADIKFAALAID